MLDRVTALTTAVTTRVRDELHYFGVCKDAGLVGGEGPRTTLAALGAMRRHGGLGGAVSVAAIRHGDAVAAADERGTVTFAELDRRTNALANALISRGLHAGDGVAVLARNHRGFLDASFGAAKVGARLIYLNTDFAGPQIREVAQREGARLLICDDEYLRFLEGLEVPLGRLRAWTDEPGADDSIDALIAAGDASPPPKPEQGASVVILTSGTTGTPKRAPRDDTRSMIGPGSLLYKVPFESGQTTVIAPPLFHSLGFASAMLSIALGSTMVLRRKFDPAGVLDDMERHRATGLVVVPVMLRRILDLGEDAISARDLSALRIVFVSGSQLGGELARRGLSALGPVIYNMYGSTEVAYATFATPEDLTAAAECVGRPPRGTKVRIVDDQGRDVPIGTTGRIFVRNSLSFGGYTSGEHKEILDDGLMSSGDVGHFDAEGRLFIDGRDDDMIVSGGENVFPQEVEDLLAKHDGVAEVAVIGVDDAKWGQRLKAFVVKKDGAKLNEDDVKSYIKSNLARYKVPRDVEFLDELPRNPTGKVLKRELMRREEEAAAK